MKTIDEKEKKLNDILNKLKNLEVINTNKISELENLEVQKNQLEIENLEMQNKYRSLKQENENLREKFEEFKKDSIILHPLARGAELSTTLDQTPMNWYFAQARGAVFVRMALLTCLMDRTTRVMDVI